ncbi:MAG: phenylalanine--tRNA ligase subunit beta [Anaerolineales bacterium]
MMKLPLSWLKDFVDIDLSVEEVASKLTLAGLEVEEIQYVGLKMPDVSSGTRHEFKTTGLEWAEDKLIVASIQEVMPHPDADRLVLCRLNDGSQEHIVLTGAPNLFEFKGNGPLPSPLKVAYALEGAEIYDGHADGLVLTKLKKTKIRGVESSSMVCSEKELGISEEHEGIIILDDDAPVGIPLAEYMGDAVFVIDILPNMARNVNVFGVARELAALTGKKLKKPDLTLKGIGEGIEGKVHIVINEPDLNPRFVLGLIRDVKIKPSPYLVQRRLRLAGIRPINCIVDATNYAMVEMGEPLHAFDYDVLKERAEGKPITILTRTAEPGEKLKTLDDVVRNLKTDQVLVCDVKGSLSIAGVMGGAESEVTENTINVLLEGASWNFINIRRTANDHALNSEASYRFSRGVHPSLAEVGVKRGLQWMASWSEGQIAPGLVDAYPKPPEEVVVHITPEDVNRLLGISLDSEEIVKLLTPLEFECTINDQSVLVKVPDFRLDIGQGIIGKADVIEEIARMYGYDHIPETRMSDELPPQVGNPSLEKEENIRDILVALGLQEVVTYRMTSLELQSRLEDLNGFVKLVNPISPEKSVLRRSLLANSLETLEKNIRQNESMEIFELGPVFSENSEGDLPHEHKMLVIAITGSSKIQSWDSKAGADMDFYDLKGILEELLKGLGITSQQYSPETADQRFHPGKCSQIQIGGSKIGIFGEIHPMVKEQYKFAHAPVIAAEIDLETLLELQPEYKVKPISMFPPILEDIALVLDEEIPAEKVAFLIQQTGGSLLSEIRLFDVFRGEKIGAGKKSLAYSLTYQASDRTLTDEDAARIRNKIVRRLENELGAKLRSS